MEAYKMRLNTVTIPVLIMLLAVTITFTPYLSEGTVRTNLGEIEVDLTGNGLKEKVVKIKINDPNNENSGIYLEVFNNKRLVKAVKLPESQDGYMYLGNSRGNLFATDIDGDGNNDILTVSMTESKESKISVLTYKNGEFTTEI
jgi:hypothetical protein